MLSFLLLAFSAFLLPQNSNAIPVVSISDLTEIHYHLSELTHTQSLIDIKAGAIALNNLLIDKAVVETGESSVIKTVGFKKAIKPHLTEADYLNMVTIVQRSLSDKEANQYFQEKLTLPLTWALQRTTDIHFDGFLIELNSILLGSKRVFGNDVTQSDLFHARTPLLDTLVNSRPVTTSTRNLLRKSFANQFIKSPRFDDYEMKLLQGFFNMVVQESPETVLGGEISTENVIEFFREYKALERKHQEYEESPSKQRELKQLNDYISRAFFNRNFVNTLLRIALTTPDNNAGKSEMFLALRVLDYMVFKNATVAEIFQAQTASRAKVAVRNEFKDLVSPEMLDHLVELLKFKGEARLSKITSSSAIAQAHATFRRLHSKTLRRYCEEKFTLPQAQN